MIVENSAVQRSHDVQVLFSMVGK